MGAPAGLREGGQHWHLPGLLPMLGLPAWRQGLLGLVTPCLEGLAGIPPVLRLAISHRKWSEGREMAREFVCIPRNNPVRV